MSIIVTLIIAFIRISFTILSESYNQWLQVQTIHTGYLSWKGTELLLGKYQALTEPLCPACDKARPLLSPNLYTGLHGLCLSVYWPREKTLLVNFQLQGISSLLCRGAQSGQHMGDRCNTNSHASFSPCVEKKPHQVYNKLCSVSGMRRTSTLKSFFHIS